MTKILLIALLTGVSGHFSGAFCQEPEQGITGTVYNAGGNHMPAPGVKKSSRPGIRSTVYIFELTNIGQVTRLGSSPYYSAIHTRLAGQTDTDSTGHFKILLPPGSYSVFTKKGDLFYAGRRDEQNNIAPVTVLPRQLTNVECSVESDHKAVY